MPTSSARTPAPSRLLRNARWATAALFFTNGALFSTLLPRYPEIKSGLDLTNTQFGLVVISFPIGAIIAGLAAAAAIRRFGAANVAVIGTVLTAAALVVVGWAPALWLLVVALFAGGAADSVTDVGQNSHGIAVQRGYGRSIINSFHAVWSAGAVTGGLMGTAAATAGVALGLHLTVSGVVWVAVALVARRFTLPSGMSLGPPLVEEHTVAGGPTRAWLRRPSVFLAALVLIAMSGTMVEDAGNTWSAVFLTQELGAGPALAGFGFVATVGAQFVGRVLGDPMTDRFGQRAVARLGAWLILGGMVLVVVGPDAWMVVAGFGLAGFGSATLVPAAMNAADDMPGMRPGTALMIVSWLMRLAFVLSPPLVGALGDTFGLRAGLAVVPVLAVGTLLVAGVLRGRGPVTGSSTRS